VTKIAASTFWEDIFEGRSLNSADMAMYTNMAINAFKKYEEMNNALPKKKK